MARSCIETPAFNLILIGLVVLLGGCRIFGVDDPQSGRLSVTFEHRSSDQPIALEQSVHTSEAGHEYSVTLLEYIVTDLTIRHEDGRTFSLADAHYVNEARPETRTLLSIEVPPGLYTHVSFTFGIPGDRNVFGRLDRTLDFDNMFWPSTPPMGDGQTERYHYMRFEGRYGENGAFRIHLGPSGGGDFSFGEELAIVFPTFLEIDGNEVSQIVVMELDEWLENPNVWDFDDFDVIMGNPDAQAILRDNGQWVFRTGGQMPLQ